MSVTFHPFICLQHEPEYTFKQSDRDAVACHADYLVSGEESGSLVEFDITLFYIIIVLISESHEKQALSRCQVSEFAPALYTTVKIQIAGVRISILLCGDSPD